MIREPSLQFHVRHFYRFSDVCVVLKIAACGSEDICSTLQETMDTHRIPKPQILVESHFSNRVCPS